MCPREVRQEAQGHNGSGVQSWLTLGSLAPRPKVLTVTVPGLCVWHHLWTIPKLFTTSYGT